MTQAEWNHTTGRTFKVQNWSAWLLTNARTALATEQAAYTHTSHATLHNQNPRQMESPSMVVLHATQLSSRLLFADNHATTQRVFSCSHLLVCGALGCFWFETNPDKLTVNICAQVLWMYVFISLGWMPGGGTAVSGGWGYSASQKLANCFPMCLLFSLLLLLLLLLFLFIFIIPVSNRGARWLLHITHSRLHLGWAGPSFSHSDQ